MNISKYILISCIVIFIASCTQNPDMKSKYRIEHVSIEDTTEDIEPPPPDLKPTFKTMEDWLFNVIDTEKPQKPIANYAIGLFESQNDRILFLIGLNKYGNNEKVDFKPLNMYLLLSKTEYKDLTREGLLDKLTTQLKDFTKTKKFETSFLAHSNSIMLSGKTIWSK